MKFFLLLLTLLFLKLAVSQTILNGDFSAGNSNWGASVETGTVATYGGVGSNKVAEVDHLVSLTQTVSGFQIGKKYSLQFGVTRRTKINQEAPNPSTLIVKVLNGTSEVVNQSITKTNTTFTFAYVEYVFFAPSTSLTFSFTPGADIGLSTRGLILDNISVSQVIALPVELISFYCLSNNNLATLHWETAAENNNDYYEIQKSTDAQNWQVFGKIKGNGDSKLHTKYSIEDKNPISGITYYRLNQVDLNGENHLSKIVSNEIFKEMNVYPNPSSNKKIYLDYDPRESQITILLFDNNGKMVYNDRVVSNEIDLSNFDSGNYKLILLSDEKWLKKMNLILD